MSSTDATSGSSSGSSMNSSFAEENGIGKDPYADVSPSAQTQDATDTGAIIEESLAGSDEASEEAAEIAEGTNPTSEKMGLARADVLGSVSRGEDQSTDARRAADQTPHLSKLSQLETFGRFDAEEETGTDPALSDDLAYADAYEDGRSATYNATAEYAGTSWDGQNHTPTSATENLKYTV